MNILKPTKQKFFNKRTFGFDIETANNNKDFVMASLYNKEYNKFFYSPKEFVEEIKTNPIFKNSVVFATNLGFDFFGTFFQSTERANFFTLFRGSSLMMAKTYFYKGNFTSRNKVKTKTLKSITFLDSLNFAKLPVAKMGEIIGKPKFESPSFLGQHPKNETELEILKYYNMRDSVVTHDFMLFIIDAFEKIGATFKNTLASTAMSLFKNKFLEDNYHQPSEDILLEQFHCYYGGRTEAFKRGYFTNMFYYDFNSLLPSVMQEYDFPDPNTLRITKKNTNYYINKYHGTSLVDIYTPYMKYPVLPVRTPNGRVIFPTGKIHGWYTHVEIREAIANGCVLTKVHKTQYFNKSCRPFKKFVDTLYNLRLQYKHEKSAMEYVVKITMNSLYGKFGQKFVDRDNWRHESTVTMKELENSTSIERKGDFIRIVERVKPSNFCIPIWVATIASYGRIKLHRAIKVSNPIYCDTDSLITDTPLPTSEKLGDLKIEMTIKEGIVVRPKFYALVNSEDEEHVKIKGLGKRLTYHEFIGLLHSPTVKYNKFTKFKEALRRDFIPNEIIEVHKTFSLEDEKRIWVNKFNPDVLEDSEPLMLEVSS